MFSQREQQHLPHLQDLPPHLQDQRGQQQQRQQRRQQQQRQVLLHHHHGCCRRRQQQQQVVSRRWAQQGRPWAEAQPVGLRQAQVAHTQAQTAAAAAKRPGGDGGDWPQAAKKSKI